MEQQSQKKALAEESLRTRKIREKLKKYFTSLEKDITSQALKKKSLEIHRWITRHASDRVILKSKSISLFDENQNAAQLSQKISKIAHNLKKGKLLE